MLPDESRQKPRPDPRSALPPGSPNGDDLQRGQPADRAAGEHDPDQRVGILVAAYIALGFLGAVGMLLWVVTAAGR